MSKLSKIITFEGIDQSGKETQSKRLTEKLISEGYKVSHMYFPNYDTSIGKEIRAFLDGKKKMSPELRQMLYATNRYEKMEEIIFEMEQCDFLVIDRYVSSGIAYGLVNGLDYKWALALEEKLPQPDFVILMDISTEVSRKRKGDDEKDEYEKRLDFLEKVRDAYLKLAEDQSWIIINAGLSKDIVEALVWVKFSEKLNKILSH